MSRRSTSIRTVADDDPLRETADIEISQILENLGRSDRRSRICAMWSTIIHTTSKLCRRSAISSARMIITTRPS